MKKSVVLSAKPTKPISAQSNKNSISQKKRPDNTPSITLAFIIPVVLLT